MSIKQPCAGWDDELLGILFGAKPFAYGAMVLVDSGKGLMHVQNNHPWIEVDKHKNKTFLLSAQLFLKWNLSNLKLQLNLLVATILEPFI